MSDEYRRVLHEWVRGFLPDKIGAVAIEDMDIDFFDGYRGAWLPKEGPYLHLEVHYRNASGQLLTWTMDDSVRSTLAVSNLLHQLFAIAAREETHP